MTEQQRCEIIKALAYGMDIQTTASCNGVTPMDVLQVHQKNALDVEAKRMELKEAYPSVF